MKANASMSKKVNHQLEHLLRRHPKLLHNFYVLDQRMLSSGSRTTLIKICRKYIEINKKQGIFKKRCETKFKYKRTQPKIRQCVVENLFKCPMCKDILDVPVTISCGHTYCRKCLSLLGDQHLGKCIECEEKLEKQTKVCSDIMVKSIVEKWKQSLEQELQVSKSILSNKANELATEFRYCLRSRCTLGCNALHNAHMKNAEISKNAMKEAICKKRKYPQASSFAAKKKWLKIISPSDIECIVCSHYLFEPVTTTCGHTFCRDCLARVFDHNIACPLCNTKLKISDQFKGETLVLTQALKLVFPKEWEQLSNAPRPLEILEENHEIPIFICTNAFPKVACPLFVYEPRYRLLSRRCLQSGLKRFGMAARSSSGDFPLYGTLIDIKDCVSFEDGTSILTTIGLRRFKIIGRDTQDGYDTASVHYIRDTIISLDKFVALQGLHNRVYSKTKEWLGTMKYRLLTEIERCLGPLPFVESDWNRLPDGPYWVWWLIAILPLNLQLRVGFLACTSLEKRLLAIEKMLDHMRSRNFHEPNTSQLY